MFLRTLIDLKHLIFQTVWKKNTKPPIGCQETNIGYSHFFQTYQQSIIYYANVGIFRLGIPVLYDLGPTSYATRMYCTLFKQCMNNIKYTKNIINAEKGHEKLI